MEVVVNYWAILLAAISSMVVGAVWYSHGVFGKEWMKLARVKMGGKVTSRQMAVMYGGTFLASLITGYILAHVTYLSHQFFKNEFLQDAVTTAFWLWLGLTAARIFVHDTFEGRRRKLTLLTISHEFVTIMAMALIIGLMGVN